MANTRLSPNQARQILLRQIERTTGDCNPTLKHEGWRFRVQSYAPGDAVLRADLLSGGLIVQGQLAVYTDRRPDSRPLVVLTPGRTFGRATPQFFPAGATFTALTGCEVWFLEPAAAHPNLASSREPVPHLAGIGRRVGPAILIMLAALLLLALPSTRRTLAVLPMGLGDWCHQRAAQPCARGAWKWAALMAPQDAAPALALGTLAFRQGDLEAAEQAFEKARESHPGSPEVHNNLGAVYYRRGQVEQAAAAFEQALVLDPGSVTAQQNLGDTLLAMQAYADAIKHYQVALSLGEPDAATLANLAVAQYQVGEAAEAQRTMEQALAQAGDEGIRQRISLTLAALQAAGGESSDH